MTLCDPHTSSDLEPGLLVPGYLSPVTSPGCLLLPESWHFCKYGLQFMCPRLPQGERRKRLRWCREPSEDGTGPRGTRWAGFLSRDPKKQQLSVLRGTQTGKPVILKINDQVKSVGFWALRVNHQGKWTILEGLPERPPHGKPFFGQRAHASWVPSPAWVPGGLWANRPGSVLKLTPILRAGLWGMGS